MKCKFCGRDLANCDTDFRGLCVKNPKSDGRVYRKGKGKK